MKKICKFKYENVIFIVLVIGFIYGVTTRTLNLEDNVFGCMSNFYTVMIQLIGAYGVKLLLEYIRKNPETLKNEIKQMFQD